MKKIIFITFVAFFFQILSFAAPVKISFLDNEEAIKQTSAFLFSKGCSRERTNLFCTVINWYNSTPTDLDLRKFPSCQNGFYSFQSVSNLINAFAHPLIYTYHQNELNCFETVILLAGNLLNTKLQTDNILGGPFLTFCTATNHEVILRVAATPKDAFNISNPEWWRESSKDIFKGSLQEERICLTSAFSAFYFFPQSTSRKELETTLMQLLKLSWKRQGIVFSKKVKVVICYNVSFDENYGFVAVSSHAGLLFKNSGNYIFIEKLGNSAPYVRLDFKDEKDLRIWLRAEIEPMMRKDDLLFGFFNNDKIESLK